MILCEMDGAEVPNVSSDGGSCVGDRKIQENAVENEGLVVVPLYPLDPPYSPYSSRGKCWPPEALARSPLTVLFSKRT